MLPFLSSLTLLTGSNPVQVILRQVLYLLPPFHWHYFTIMHLLIYPSTLSIWGVFIGFIS